ncbi:MAG: phosphopantothenoylcysteine decarboxylase [Candidatus Brocadiia bacterium]
MAEDLTGRRILITSGPTRADLDAVRYVSNRSTGRLGAAMAAGALGRGAEVVLIAGPNSALPDRGNEGRLQVVDIETVPDLLEALEAELTGPQSPDAVLHAMAVLDYLPAEPQAGKKPSGEEEWTIRLVRGPKVIKSIRRWAPEALLVQFKLEVGVDDEELRRRALESLRANRADLAVANDLSRIRGETHPVLVIDPRGRVLARPATKGEIARALCDLLAERL